MDGSETPDTPRRSTTAPGSSAYAMHRGESADPPLLEGLGLVELGHHPGNNRVRAI